LGTDRTDKSLDDGLLSVLAGRYLAHPDDNAMGPSTVNAGMGTPLGGQAAPD
jgi:hypothetical protein